MMTAWFSPFACILPSALAAADPGLIEFDFGGALLQPPLDAHVGAR